MEELRALLKKYWGFDQFRPFQADAIGCVLGGRDSVVVLPTGGGKSLCFQAPALHLPGLAVVVSPLISLMKDQVDALAQNGVPAAAVNSTMTEDERLRVANEIRAGRLKLLYMAPERLLADRTLDFLGRAGVSFFAIDEAHCISDWGHDFRPEYRDLKVLKERFPDVAVHAYTATATARVRDDIARELGLKKPAVLVGSFDRPNLVYRVQRRTDRIRQVREVIDRHPNESGIIYCISRANVDELADTLDSLGYRALPYHAGMTADDRRRNQEAFQQDRADIIVATVAFGMGIDKSNVRYVVHAGAPKSLESYQQESGRAGRDGLEADCVLLASDGDFLTWRKLQSNLEPRAYEVAMTVLGGIERYCQGTTCRHRALVEYFDQEFDGGPCGACDVCLDELDLVDDALVIAQKILSCVLRLKESFGAEYTALVLCGSADKRILEKGHDRLSTYALLSEHDKRHVRGWMDQLIGQGHLEKAGEYNVLQLTAEGRRVLRGELTPALLRPAARKEKKSRVEEASWEGVDRGLFDVLRSLRRRLADERAVPPFVVFSDATLRDMARRRPSSSEQFLEVGGVGEKKRADYGDLFLEALGDYCRRNGLAMDVPGAPKAIRERSADSGEFHRPIPGRTLRSAFDMFDQGRPIDEVGAALGRVRSTTVGYLAEFIAERSITDPSAWLDPALFARIRKVAEEAGIERLKPIHEALGGEVDYDSIRIAVTCLRNEGQTE